MAPLKSNGLKDVEDKCEMKKEINTGWGESGTTASGQLIGFQIKIQVDFYELKIPFSGWAKKPTQP